MEHKQPPQSLATILNEIFFTSHDNALLLVILEAVAVALRAMHAAGQFIPGLNDDMIGVHHLAARQPDLPRITFSQAVEQSSVFLDEATCAQQIASVRLPDDYWRIFKYMYFSGQTVPASFAKLADDARAQMRRQQLEPVSEEKNMWVWDEKSAQPMALLASATKRKLRKSRDLLAMLWRVLPAWPKLGARYKKLLPHAFSNALTMKARVGVALHPSYWPQEKHLLAQLGNLPVLLRFYCHESAEQWQATVAIIDELKTLGIEVAIALVQDRQAVIAAEHWERFVRAVIPKVHDKVIWCEVGHAINRVKWGVWTAKEYRKLFMAVYNAAKKYPHLKLIAPAVIDFEWYRIVDALRCLPRNISLYAVSQHLYVDRRGAPENFQGRYSTLEKCALSKAIAVQQKNCADRFIISEVNWPLQDTGIYSPIGSPYTAPQWFADRPGETELDYASYLIRYCAIALCSGFAHSIFVWRLSAHGFGLVDDLDNFRPRPAFYALQTWLARLHNNQFVARLSSPSHCYLLHFKGAVECLLAWTTEAQYVWSQPWSAVKTYSLTGEILSLPDADVILTPQPIYICKES